MELESNGVFDLPVELILHKVRTIGLNGNSGSVLLFSDLEQIEGMTITIVNSEHPTCLKRARQ